MGFLENTIHESVIQGKLNIFMLKDMPVGSFCQLISISSMIGGAFI